MNPERFTGANAAMLLIDHQIGTMSWVRSAPLEEIKRNTIVLAKVARALKIARPPFLHAGDDLGVVMDIPPGDTFRRGRFGLVEEWFVEAILELRRVCNACVVVYDFPDLVTKPIMLGDRHENFDIARMRGQKDAIEAQGHSTFDRFAGQAQILDIFVCEEVKDDVHELSG